LEGQLRVWRNRGGTIKFGAKPDLCLFLEILRRPTLLPIFSQFDRKLVKMAPSGERLED
jgi:hypothetical protein